MITNSDRCDIAAYPNPLMLLRIKTILWKLHEFVLLIRPYCLFEGLASVVLTAETVTSFSYKKEFRRFWPRPIDCGPEFRWVCLFEHEPLEHRLALDFS